jgi:enoyl-CoA hydratase
LPPDKTQLNSNAGQEERANMRAFGPGQLHVRRDKRARGVVAYVTIDNPHRLNAITSALMRKLAAAMGTLAGDGDLRAIVLTGAGPKSFSVGADIDEMAAIDGPAAAKAFVTRLHECCASIRELPVPVIARIQGYCFGGGLEMAAACDVRIASESACFGMQEVRLGIPSVIEAALLPMLVGFGRAREIMFLGETFTAAEALAWGLVERVVPAAALDAAVELWIGKLLSSAPRAVRLQKRLIRQWEDLSLKAAVQAGIDAFAEAYGSDEPATSMRKFLAARRTQRRRR